MAKFRFRGKKFWCPINPTIRIIDYGNAVDPSDFGYVTINTRQFRAPEVMLKLQKWDYKSDLWSVGCILMELFTGKLLFPTNHTYEHLLMIEKVTGKFFSREKVQKLRAYQDVYPYFDQSRSVPSFLLRPHEVSLPYGVSVALNLPSIAELIERDQFNPRFEREIFKDFILKLLTLDPEDRPSAREALNHNFFSALLDEHYDGIYKQMANYRSPEKSTAN